MSSTDERLAREVAGFYDDLVFPSRTGDAAYRRFLPGEPGERVGDFGCGQSLFHDALRDYAPPPTYLDVSRNVLATIEHGLRVAADLRHLPFRDGAYDRIWCIGVLHHLPEREPVLREIARVLRPGGRLFLGVYAPGTVNAWLRRAHDAHGSRPWRAAVSGMTAGLIALRYLMRGKVLAPGDVRARATDFLEVPFVRYLDPEIYLAEARRAGLRSRGVHRISAMNVIELERTEGRT